MVARPAAGKEATPDDPRSGFYDRRYTLAEIADLLRLSTDDSLKDELAAARVAVRRVLEHLEEELTPHEFAHLAQVIFTGTKTIVSLLQAQHDLADPAAVGFAWAIHQALDEMAREMNIPL